MSDQLLTTTLRNGLEKSGLNVAGFGNAVITAIIEIKIVDRNGKSLLHITKSANSDTKVPYIFGDIINTEALPQAIESASINVHKVTIEFLKKKLQ